jgi:hypothetical protein
MANLAAAAAGSLASLRPAAAAATAASSTFWRRLTNSSGGGSSDGERPLPPAATAAAAAAAADAEASASPGPSSSLADAGAFAAADALWPTSRRQKAAAARRALMALEPEDVVERLQTAGNLYAHGTLTLGDTRQSPEDFVKQQSATTGLPESLCRANMQKNMFVLSNMDRILDALSRGLDPAILWRGYGVEQRGVTVSYQAQSPVLGLVLPSNSPGVHTLWLPVVALGVGLLMKPGSQEPWTPYRRAAAMVEAGIPAEAIGLYPGATDVGAGILAGCRSGLQGPINKDAR